MHIVCYSFFLKKNCMLGTCCPPPKALSLSLTAMEMSFVHFLGNTLLAVDPQPAVSVKAASTNEMLDLASLLQPALPYSSPIGDMPLAAIVYPFPARQSRPSEGPRYPAYFLVLFYAQSQSQQIENPTASAERLEQYWVLGYERYLRVVQNGEARTTLCFHAEEVTHPPGEERAETALFAKSRKKKRGKRRVSRRVAGRLCMASRHHG